MRSDCRNRNIDCLKGLLIFLVLLGHVIQYGSGTQFFAEERYFDHIVFKIIYSFHMPCFGLVSGLLYGRYVKKKSFRYKLVKCIKSFIMPMMSVGIFCVVYEAYKQNIDISMLGLGQYYLNIVLYKWWFVWVIIVSYLIFGVIDSFKFSLSAKFVLVFMIQIIMLVIPDYINTPLIGFIFFYFAVGYFLAEKEIKEENIEIAGTSICFQKFLRGGVKFTGVWFVLLCFFGRRYYIYVTKLSLQNGFWNQLEIDLFRWCIGLVGSIAVLCLFCRITPCLPEKLISILQYMGRRTLLIYMIQDFILPNYIYLKPNLEEPFLFFINLFEAGFACFIICGMLVLKERFCGEDFMRNIRKVVVVVLLIAFLVLLYLCAFVKTRENNMGQESAALLTDPVTMSVWGESFSIDPSVPEYTISCRRLTTEFPVEFGFAGSEGWDIHINGTAVSGECAQIQISGIGRSADPVKVEFSNRSNAQKMVVYVKSLPDDFPNIETYSDGAQPGKYYFVVHGFLTKMDEKGNIVFYQKENLALGQDTDVEDFRQVWNQNGEKRYYFIRRSENSNLSTYQAYEYVIMDEAYDVIDVISYMSESDKVTGKIMHDNHEFVYIDDNHYIEVAYVNKRVYNIPNEVGSYEYGSNIQAAIIQEIKNGEVIWSWDSSDYPQLYGLSTDDLTADTDIYANYTDVWSDYAHLNSVEIDPIDGNLVCSFRHFDSVIELNRVTGQIEWILGGIADEFGLSEEQKFSHQHAARFTQSGTLILFDNANGKGFSRAIEMKLDEKNKVLVSYESYQVEQQKSQWMGNVQKLSDSPSTVLIGWGGRGGDSRNTLLLSEVDTDNKKILFEASCNVDNYRVYKFND